MKKEIFLLGDVLAIVTGRPVSVRKEGVPEVVNFMCRGRAPEGLLPKAQQLAKEHLLKQFPELGAPAMEERVKFLDAQLSVSKGQQQDWAKSYWCNEIAAEHGSVLEVRAIPIEDLAALSEDSESAANK